MMHLTPGPSTCFVNLHHGAWDPENESRKLTCGLEANDTSVIQPGKPMFGPEGSGPFAHLTGLPPGVTQKVFFPCLRNELQMVTKLSFPRSLSSNYTCKASPKCINGEETSHIVCYTTERVHFSLCSGGFNKSKEKNILVAILAMWVVFWLVECAS